jgi:gamma-glutamylcyclotransferase (GGCT)/AIG2-like uncharacterized protein YtfP
MKRRIFVYGTLKRGGRYAHFLKGQAFVGEAQTAPVYRMVDAGSYPGMHAAKKNGTSIQGEVWEVDEDSRARLDELEDVSGGEYELVKVKLLAPFDAQEVFTYLFLRADETMPDAGTNWDVSQ